MFQFLQVRQQPNKVAPDPGSVSLRQLRRDDLRMVRQIRRHAGVNSFPGAVT